MHYRCHFFLVSLLLLGLSTSPTPLSAQKVTFTHLTTDDGLPFNNIEVILQDRRGYLWFGTGGGGLVRYDGYEMRVYRHVPGDSTSLPPGRILDLQESADGTLWVGTQNGLSRFDASKETFKVYRHVEGDATSLSHDYVWGLHESSDGTLWVGTTGGLSRFDASTETFETYRHVPGDPTSLGFGRVRTFHESADGTLWIGTEEGLSRFDASTETFETYRHVEGDPTSLGRGWVWALYETRDGTLWVGTVGGGLSRFDASTKTFKTYRHVPGDPTSLSSDLVWAFHEADDGTLWVGTDGGFNRFDASTETFETYRHVPGDPTSLSHNRAWALHETDDGTLWIGTLAGGISILDSAAETFKVYRHVPGDPTSLSHDIVGVLHESADGTLWVGRRGGNGGLSRFDPVSETFEDYGHVVDRVRALHESADGTLWVGTPSGLRRFGSAMETPEVFQHVEGDSTSLGGNWVGTLLEADNGTLWVGTEGGLSRFDAAKETFKVYRHVEGDPTSLSHDIVQALEETDDGSLWIATSGGLSRFDAATETFETYRHDPGDPTSLSHNRVWALHETDDGTLWVNTASGLSRMERDPDDPASISFTHFLDDIESRGRSILEDEEGQLWLGLSNGRLIRFNPETRQARFFGKRYGLPTGGFNNNILRSRNGILYWANSAGLVSLRLDRLPPPSALPKVYLSDLWLFEERLTPGPDAPLKQALSQTESLQLSHDQNDLTFGYVAIHYADPEENRYQYRLLGYDQDWRSETDQRRATYTNLPPGQYTFEVKAANSDGIWTEEPVRLDVEILPPWWRTMWAYGLYALLLIGAVFAADRFQRRRLIAKERDRAREHELEQAREIEKAHTELQQTHTQLAESHQHLKTTQAQLVQSEKMASLGQLTAGIAHEIKNPLNFVNNFAEVNEELTDELQELLGHEMTEAVQEVVADLKQNAQVIAKHGKRADGIVKSMMEHARGGEGQRQSTDVNAFVEEYFSLAYHGMRAKVPDFNATLDRDYDEEVGSVEMVPQDIGRVLINLLNNAFYAVHEKARAINGAYEPTVTVSTRQEEGQVEIRVMDNGMGISSEVKNKIFEPFFTTKPTGKGNTGLGLSLSYDIITQGHGGTLTVESEEDRGASFIIMLPVKKTGPTQR